MPRLHERRPQIRTKTSLLLPGRIAGVPVLAKHPVDPRPFWQNRCRHEITVYQALARAGSVPVLTPAGDRHRPGYPVLVITRLSGRPLHPRRYPSGPVAPSTLTKMLETLQVLHSWRPSPAFPDDSDYPAHSPDSQRPDTTRRPEAHHLAVQHHHAAPAA